MKSLPEVYDFLALKLNFLGQIYIAGGAVRDHLMGRKPKDFDLFILAPEDRTSLYSSAETFRDFCRLELHLETFETNLEWHKSEPYLLTNIRLDAETEVQVMHRNLTSPHDLVNTFDWDICQYAYGNGRTIIRRDVSTIKPGEYLNLNKITFAASTLRRGYRFSERFGLRIRNEDLFRLCDLVKGSLMSQDYYI